MTTDAPAPHMLYRDDLAQVLSDGADAMATMIMESFASGELPPADLFAWYVKYAVLRFIEAEYELVYAETPTKEQGEDFAVLRAAVHKVRGMVNKSQQFGLAAEITNMLKARQLHLPQAYINASIRDDL